MERSTETNTAERSIPDVPLSVTAREFIVLTDAMREFGHSGITIEFEVTDWGDDDPDRVELDGYCSDVQEQLFHCGRTAAEAFVSIEDHVSAIACEMYQEAVRADYRNSIEWREAAY